MRNVERTVFISYRRTNAPWALAIFKELTHHGYDVFFDYTGIPSGDFERVVLENIGARAHFLVLLSPTTLDRCSDPEDLLRREVQTALDTRRNVVPLMLDGFEFTATETAQLSGQLAVLARYNGLHIHVEYFDAAMERLREQYLSVPLEMVLHPLSTAIQDAAERQRTAAVNAPVIQPTELTKHEYLRLLRKASDLSDELRLYSQAFQFESDRDSAPSNLNETQLAAPNLAPTQVKGQIADSDNPVRLRSRRSMREQEDLATLVQLTDDVIRGLQQPPTEIGITWDSHHFIKGHNGNTYVPYTLTIDRNLAESGVALYVRVVAMRQLLAPSHLRRATEKNRPRDEPRRPLRLTYPWDNIYFVEIPAGGRVSRAMMLSPGEYEALISVRGRVRSHRLGGRAAPAVADAIGFVRHLITIPNFNVADLTTSSVILATSVDQHHSAITPEQQDANPYVFGPMRITPAQSAALPESGELSVIFWIYGAGVDSLGKPDVIVEYHFYQVLSGELRYFNKTAPQEFNEDTLPTEFNAAAGHQLPGSLVVPLRSFPVGKYRLEIKVADMLVGDSVTQDVDFTIVAG
jgi:hypothetical protein